MGRWEPNAEGRLREAAMELFLERGYEQTTVADIAERAGLTARTFFRYFADKREVLFVVGRRSNGRSSTRSRPPRPTHRRWPPSPPRWTLRRAARRQPRVLARTAGGDRRQRRVARARADQDGLARHRPGRRAAPPRRHRPAGRPRGRDRASRSCASRSRTGGPSRRTARWPRSCARRSPTSPRSSPDPPRFSWCRGNGGRATESVVAVMTKTNGISAAVAVS